MFVILCRKGWPILQDELEMAVNLEPQALYKKLDDKLAKLKGNSKYVVL